MVVSFLRMMFTPALRDQSHYRSPFRYPPAVAGQSRKTPAEISNVFRPMSAESGLYN